MLSLLLVWICEVQVEAMNAWLNDCWMSVRWQLTFLYSPHFCKSVICNIPSLTSMSWNLDEAEGYIYRILMWLVSSFPKNFIWDLWIPTFSSPLFETMQCILQEGGQHLYPFVVDIKGNTQNTTMLFQQLMDTTCEPFHLIQINHISSVHFLKCFFLITAANLCTFNFKIWINKIMHSIHYIFSYN